ncbi:phage head completion protein [Nocardioides alkalitolerans]|uniref:phage head completion protein n=1 Tax=Nocardioides alkalitolerans TaxID=281714 RepID=UPI000409D516|nr:head-tail adaptor protein [Nocardioides alkalitolerans]
MTDPWYDRRVELWRPTSVPDGRGGRATTMARVEIPGAAGDLLAVKIDQPSATEQLVAAQSQSRHTHNVYTDGDADVRRGDELREGERTYRVEAVVRPSEPVYTKALCELDQHEGQRA